jgi:nucleoside-diphosphate-sugar epimerase
VKKGVENNTIAHMSRGLGIIVGGSGLIGGALVYYFKNRVSEVEVLAPNSKRLNLTKPEDIRLYFQQYKPDFIVNSAVASINSTAELAYEVNYLGALNLANIALEYNIPYIHISSAATMPTGENLREDSRLALCADLPNYTKSKLMAEMSLEHLAKTRGLDYTIVRLAIVYGRHDYKIQGFHRLLFSIADQAMPILLTKKGAKHSYSNVRKIAPFIHHLLKHRQEFSGQTYNFADPTPVALGQLVLTIKALMNLKTPHALYLPLSLAKMGKNLVHWLIRRLSRVGIEAMMPGEIQFLENFYETQTLDVEKLQNSSYNDIQSRETVYSVLPKLIEYYITRWENLNLIRTFNKEFYDSEKHRIDEFRDTPDELLIKIHSEKDRLLMKSE